MSLAGSPGREGKACCGDCVAFVGNKKKRNINKWRGGRAQKKEEPREKGEYLDGRAKRFRPGRRLTVWKEGGLGLLARWKVQLLLLILRLLLLLLMGVKRGTRGTGERVVGLNLWCRVDVDELRLVLLRLQVLS